MTGPFYPPGDDEARRVTLVNNAAVFRSRSGVSFVYAGLDREPAPRVEIHAWGPEPGAEAIQVELGLGETVEVAGETWRLWRISAPRGNQIITGLRLVDESEPQDSYVCDIHLPVRFLPYGKLSDKRVNQAARDLGCGILPQSYRLWLQENNGAQPEVPVRVPEHLFVLTPERPLLGVHPDYEPFDLIAAQRTWRDTYLTPKYLVIAVPGGLGGLLVLSVEEDHTREGIFWMPPARMTGQPDPATIRQDLTPIARSIWELLDLMVPYDESAPPPPSAPTTFTSPLDLARKRFSEPLRFDENGWPIFN